MQSFWQKDVEPKKFESLTGDRKTDVLIVGGGLTGLLCARRLRDAGVDCMLVEADAVCRGVTGYTTAKITLQHGAIFAKLIRRFGEEGARLYVEAQREAANEYDELCEEIDCDYERRDSFVYSLRDEAKMEREAAALNRLGARADFLTHLSLPFRVAGAVRVADQAQFHPLKFAYAIAEGLPICEHTKVTELRPGKAVTQRGEISYRTLVVTTHFPFDNKHGAFFLKLYQHRSYVLALKGAPTLDGMYVDEAVDGLSFRAHGDLLFLGGGGHRTGKQGGCWQELEDFARRYYPHAAVVAKWAAQDCMTLDDIPYIGQYSKSTPDVFVATGFHKWGMTNAMVAARLLSDLILGRQNPYEKLFSPSRTLLRPQLAVNALESLVGLLTPTAPRCPHLGCALKYNRAEHSWDCPCHGSRFTKEGKLLKNPATADHPKKPLL